MFPDDDIYNDENNRPAVGTRVHFTEYVRNSVVHHWGVVKSHTKKNCMVQRLRKVCVKKKVYGVETKYFVKPTDELTEDILLMHWSKTNVCWMINYDGEQCPVYGYIPDQIEKDTIAFYD